uniref:Uncharacterized protein n=1 Tax=Lepeophtheirus salmonis TaxID=72036 RepID=A0A0K2VJ56_LEPSM
MKSVSSVGRPGTKCRRHIFFFKYCIIYIIHIPSFYFRHYRRTILEDAGDSVHSGGT